MILICAKLCIVMVTGSNRKYTTVRDNRNCVYPGYVIALDLLCTVVVLPSDFFNLDQNRTQTTTGL